MIKRLGYDNRMKVVLFVKIFGLLLFIVLILFGFVIRVFVELVDVGYVVEDVGG